MDGGAIACRLKPRRPPDLSGAGYALRRPAGRTLSVGRMALQLPRVIEKRASKSRPHDPGSPT